MTEWWTYRISDFLLFSPKTYHRLFELYNADLGPGRWLVFGLGALTVAAAAAGGARWPRLAWGLVGAAWLWVAWAFHLERYAGIHWLAPWFAAAFVVQGLALLGVGVFAAPATAPDAGRAQRIGLGLLLFAWLVQPGLGALLGRPWSQAQWFGLAPDPTVLGTLGLLLTKPPARSGAGALLWVIPVSWCAVAGATLWAMDAPEAPLLPAAALLALAARRLN